MPHRKAAPFASYVTTGARCRHSWLQSVVRAQKILLSCHSSGGSSCRACIGSSVSGPDGGALNNAQEAAAGTGCVEVTPSRAATVAQVTPGSFGGTGCALLAIYEADPCRETWRHPSTPSLRCCRTPEEMTSSVQQVGSRQELHWRGVARGCEGLQGVARGCLHACACNEYSLTGMSSTRNVLRSPSAPLSRPKCVFPQSLRQSCVGTPPKRRGDFHEQRAARRR